MKRFSAAFLILLVSFVFHACKGEGDEIATYKGGSITRGEFYKWLEARHHLKDSVLKSKKKQENKINKMMLEIIAVEKAKAEGFDKKEDFKIRKDLTEEGQLIKRLYEKEITEKVEFEEPAIKLKQILLGVRPSKIERDKSGKAKQPDKNEMDKKLGEAMIKAKDIIQKLNNGEKFEELAKKHSDHHSKMKGGDIGYSVRSMLPPEFEDVAFKLEEGEYSKEPIKTSRGVFIIKIEEKQTITDKNIEDIIENKTQAKMIKNRIQGSHSKEYLDNLEKAEDVTKDFDKVSSKNKKAVVFKIGEKAFTLEDLDKKIEMRMKGFKGKQKLPEITDERKKAMAKNFFRYELLKRDAYKKGVDKEEDFVKQVQMTLDDVLAREYMKAKFEQEGIVTLAEIKDEYEKNKDKKYYKMVKKNKKRVKEVEPFNKVKVRIERVLKRRKGSEMKEKWKKEILKEYEFVIDESVLEGK